MGVASEREAVLRSARQFSIFDHDTFAYLTDFLTRIVNGHLIGDSTTSMPINLPFERISLPQQKNGRSCADDRGKDPELSKAIISTLGKKFREPQFYSPGAWSCYYCETDRFDIADWLPSRIVEGVATPEAEKRASEEPISQWVFVLRNALAHGGIVVARFLQPMVMLGGKQEG